MPRPCSGRVLHHTGLFPLNVILLGWVRMMRAVFLSGFFAAAVLDAVFARLAHVGLGAAAARGGQRFVMALETLGVAQHV
jgi:hypothetical protein